MEFRFTAEEEAFRQEIRSFLRRELPADWAARAGSGALGEDAEDQWQFLRAFQRKLADRGWLTQGWPREHGGLAAGVMMQVIYNEEMSYHRAPTQIGVGPDRVGPTIILYGTDEQKARHLPGIANAETVWCQGFSEPEAGSDLASLQTRAQADGDSFVLNGQKIWTSLAHQADWCILLARTDQEAPKHKGISYFLLNMKTPGVTVRPLVDMTGRHTFNELFMEDARVPRDCLVGELNRGWYIAAATLDFERSGINRVVAGFRAYEELLEYARGTQMDGRPPMAEGTVRNKLADLGIEFYGRPAAGLPRGLDAGEGPDPQRRGVDVQAIWLGASAATCRRRTPGPRPGWPACPRQQMGAPRRAAAAVLPVGLGTDGGGRNERDHARHHRRPRPRPAPGIEPSG